MIILNSFIRRFTSFIKSRRKNYKNLFEPFSKLNWGIHSSGILLDVGSLTGKEYHKIVYSGEGQIWELAIGDTDSAIPDYRVIGPMVFFSPNTSHSIIVKNISENIVDLDLKVWTSEWEEDDGIMTYLVNQDTSNPSSYRSWRVIAGASMLDFLPGEERRLEVPALDKKSTAIIGLDYIEGGVNRTPTSLSVIESKYEHIYITDIPRDIRENIDLGYELNSPGTLVSWSNWESSLDPFRRVLPDKIVPSIYVNDQIMHNISTRMALNKRAWHFSPFCGPSMTTMADLFNGYVNISGDPVCGPGITNMDSAYAGCLNLTGSAVIGQNVSSAVYAYKDCSGLTGIDIRSKNCKNLYGAFSGCVGLSGNLEINVTNAEDTSYMFQNCSWLGHVNGLPLDPKNTAYMFDNCMSYNAKTMMLFNSVNMAYMYNNCKNVYGEFYIGEKVVNASHSFYATEKPGYIHMYNEFNNKEDLSFAYANSNAFGSWVSVNKQWTLATHPNMQGTFANCPGIKGVVFSSTAYGTAANINARLKGMINRLGCSPEAYEKTSVIFVNGQRSGIATIWAGITDVTAGALVNTANEIVEIPLMMENGYVYDNMKFDTWGYRKNDQYNLYLYVGRPL